MPLAPLQRRDAPAADPNSPAGYFAEVQEAFTRAVATTADIRRYYKIGPDIMCLRFAGEGLLDALTRAFAHNETAPGPAALTVCCWDSASTRTLMPKPPWPLTAYGVKGHIEGYNTAAIRTLYQPGADILNMLDVGRQTGIYWMQDPAQIPYWERGFPMRNILHWWSEQSLLQLVHAGAIGTERGGVLLTGKGGSGKSTTALACLASSLLSYVGDDYVLIGNASGPYVYSLSNSAKLGPESLARVPHLAGKMDNPGNDEKALFFIHEHFPEKLRAGFPVKAIFLPRVTAEKDTRLRPASKAAALLALAPTTVFQMEGASKPAFAKMRRFAESVPSYWLELGSDPAQIPDVIARFLEGPE
jgi:hypothetical protein